MKTASNIKVSCAPLLCERGPFADRRLQGIITPLVTPILDRDTLDHEGLSRLVEHVLFGRVNGLFLLGTTGEAAALSAGVHRELIRRVMDCVAARVPILVGVSNNSVVESLKLARAAADVGADAIVITTPSYLPLDQDELVGYIRLVERESPLPVVLYNMPRLTSHWFSVETVRQAMQLENVIGLKDSSGDMSYFGEVCELLSERPDWSLLTGSEMHLATAVKLGAHGCVGGGSNLWPQLLVDLYHAAVDNDEIRIGILQQELLEMGKIYQFGTHATGVIRGIKCSLETLGICSGRMADPFEVCDGTQQAFIKQQLLILGLITAGDHHPERIAACSSSAVQGPGYIEHEQTC